MERIKAVVQMQKTTSSPLQPKQEEAKSAGVGEIFPEKTTNENEIIENLEKVLDENFKPKTDEEIKKLSEEEKIKYYQNQHLVKSILKNPQNYEKFVAIKLRSKLADELATTGGIGAVWSALKNKFNFGASSEKAEEKIEQLEQGKITDIEAKKAVSDFLEGQEEALDTTADLVTGVTAVGTFATATAISVGTLGLGTAPAFAAATATTMTVAAGTKVAIKAVDKTVIGDKEYTAEDAMYDSLTGAVDGAVAPIAQGLGGTVAKAFAGKAGVKATGAVAKTACIEAVKTTGKETSKKTVLNTLKKTGMDIVYNPAGFTYSGGTAKARATAYAVESGLSGVIDGGISNGARAALKGEDIGNAVLTGATTGAALGPVMTLGAKGAGKISDKIMRYVDDNFRLVPDLKYEPRIYKLADKIDEPETPTMKELWAKLEKEVAEENASLKPVQKTSQKATEMPENIGAGRKRLQELIDIDTRQTQIMTSFKDELKTFKLENIKEEKLKTEYIRALNRIKRYKNLLPEDKIREVIGNLDSKCKRLNAGGSAVLKTSDLIEAYYTGGSYLGLNDMLRGTKRWSIKKKSIGIQEAHSFEECIQYNLELALKRKREIEIIQHLDNRMVSEASEPMTVYRGENGEWSNSRSLNNNIIEDKGFCSTSLSKETGKKFARFGGKFWTINLPKGTKFCDLRSSAEQEILLPRNSRFKVIDAEKRILELIVEN